MKFVYLLRSISKVEQGIVGKFSVTALHFTAKKIIYLKTILIKDNIRDNNCLKICVFIHGKVLNINSISRCKIQKPSAVELSHLDEKKKLLNKCLLCFCFFFENNLREKRDMCSSHVLFIEPQWSHVLHKETFF